jgi:predicted Zn-dependent protease
MRMILAACLVALPHFAVAAGSDDTEPPQPTATTTECAKGQVWDDKTKACVQADGAGLTDDQRFGAVRELAYADRPDEALAMLASMSEGDTPRVLTYQGFLLRKTGQVAAGIAAYERAISAEPSNILARSYYGQLLVQMQDIGQAKAQLAAIRSHGGAGTWAERALSDAIQTGVTYTY